MLAKTARKARVPVIDSFQLGKCEYGGKPLPLAPVVELVKKSLDKVVKA